MKTDSISSPNQVKPSHAGHFQKTASRTVPQTKIHVEERKAGCSSSVLDPSSVDESCRHTGTRRKLCSDNCREAAEEKTDTHGTVGKRKRHVVLTAAAFLPRFSSYTFLPFMLRVCPPQHSNTTCLQFLSLCASVTMCIPSGIVPFRRPRPQSPQQDINVKSPLCFSYSVSALTEEFTDRRGGGNIVSSSGGGVGVAG